MNLTEQIAKHFREIHFGGNWTCSNLKDTLADVTWQQATTQVPSFNTIVALTYHINYFVTAVLKVLEGGPLDAHDKFSFDHPPINSQEEWERLLHRVWDEAERCATLIEQLPENKLGEDFVEAKYGSYYRNLHGLIEHSHYHLGQIVIIKKVLGLGIRDWAVFASGKHLRGFGHEWKTPLPALFLRTPLILPILLYPGYGIV